MTSLSSFDRCDRCGSQAYFTATKGRGKGRKKATLLFCAHHGRKHGADLIAEGWIVSGDEQALTAIGDTVDSLSYNHG